MRPSSYSFLSFAMQKCQSHHISFWSIKFHAMATKIFTGSSSVSGSSAPSLFHSLPFPSRVSPPELSIFSRRRLSGTMAFYYKKRFWKYGSYHWGFQGVYGTQYCSISFQQHRWRVSHSQAVSSTSRSAKGIRQLRCQLMTFLIFSSPIISPWRPQRIKL